MKKPYWVYPKGDDWVMLAFARSNFDARKIGFNNSPVADDNAPYIDWRAKRADDKWMALYSHGVECLDCTPSHYDTWESYWKAEHGDEE